MRTPPMSHAWPRSRSDLSLPRWAFVAWLVRRGQLRAGPRPTLPMGPETDIEVHRRARLLRELAPQDV